MVFLVLLSVIGSLTNCQKTIIKAETNSKGRSTIVIDGVTRSFYTKVPQNYNNDLEYSLMFYLHAAGETAVDVMNKGFTEKAHKVNFIIVYPTGLSGNWKLYNDTDKGNSDVNFITTLIDTLSAEYNIDKKRVYSSGRSLGGFMSFQLAYEIPDKIAAISVISGSMFPEDIHKKQKPISVQHIHALDDNMIPYISSTDQVLSVPESIDYWLTVNKTSKDPIEFFNQNGIVGKRWLADGTKETTELITHIKGGHSSLPLTPNFVIDFFYNNPPRGTK